MFSDSITLKQAYKEFMADANAQSEIPLIIRLLENPKSPFALPGNIDLFGHDCFHILLNRGKSAFDEAFVIGVTMGNDPRTNKFHLLLFKMSSSALYPEPYRFNETHLVAFDLGFHYGRNQLNQVYGVKFSSLMDLKLGDLRKQFGILASHLQMFKQVERGLGLSDALSQPEPLSSEELEEQTHTGNIRTLEQGTVFASTQFPHVLSRPHSIVRTQSMGVGKQPQVA